MHCKCRALIAGLIALAVASLFGCRREPDARERELAASAQVRTTTGGGQVVTLPESHSPDDSFVNYR